MLDRKLWRNVDAPILVGLVVLSAASIAIISAASAASGQNGFHYPVLQAAWVLLGAVVILFALSQDYLVYPFLTPYLYWVTLGVLVGVLVVGHSALGSERWISIGPFQLQPSEFAKVVIILTLADYLARHQGKLNSLKDLVVPFVYVIVPVVLILKQPDLGTSLVFMAILFGMLLVAGAPIRYLVLIYGGGLALVVGAVYLHYRFGIPVPLHDYQLKRLVAFLNPNADPLGSGYNIIQSKIAVGSGGLLGTGALVRQLSFLPENRTDFIFAALGEETGFLGSLGVLVIYLVLLWRATAIASAAKDFYGTLLVVGAISMFAFQVLENAGMAMGLMPVAGVPLPFFSYGGSAFLADSIVIGILLNVGMRRRKILF